MTKVLMLTPYLPYPPVSGGRMRTYSLVKRLSKDHDITLVCFGRPEEREFDLEPFREYCELIVIDRATSPGVAKAALMTLTSIKPITMRLYTSTEFKATISSLLNKQSFDVIHIESFYMLQNIPSDNTLPILLSEPAIEYMAWQRHAKVAEPFYQRPGIALEALKMRVYEPRTWKQVDVVGVMSDYDAEIIRKVTPQTKTALAPNGVDVEYFQPSNTPRDSATAMFMGDYKYFPNTDAAMYFIKEIMPLIRNKRPDFRLTLIGKDPTPELVAISNDPNSGVTATGLVDDTRPYLTQSTLFVCPLRSGSGTRFKLLEALACGLPVISTSIGSEGLVSENSDHMILADTPQAFADAVLKILSEPETAEEIGQEGRKWVVENHAWEYSAGQIANVYQELIAKNNDA